MTTMQEWVDQFIYSDDYQWKMRSGCNDPQPQKPSTKADTTLLYCEPCGKVWNWYSTSRGRNWIRYPKGNIPTIGKDRENCPICSQ